MATLAGGGPGGDATSLARSVGPQVAPLCGIGRVARPPSARLGRAAGTLNLAQERSAHVRAGPCAERSGDGHQRFGCPTPSAYESQERFDVACGREREWVVSGGVCFGAHPRGPWRVPTLVGAGHPCPAAKAWCADRARSPVGAPRYLRLAMSTCARNRDGSRVSAYGRTTFSTRDPGGAEITEYYKTSQGFVMCDNFL